MLVVKKEITDAATKWIGNHRFCVNCAAPPKNITFEKAISENENKLKEERPCSILTNKDEFFNRERMRILEQQLSQIDAIIDNAIKKQQKACSVDCLAKIKKQAEFFFRRYILDPKDAIFTFYWSEYPMGATHCKEFRRINSVWCVYQYDYDRRPGERIIEYPNINDNNFLESFVEILLTESDYK